MPFNKDFDYEIMTEVQDYLNKKESCKQKNIYENMSEKIKKIDLAKDMYEEYDFSSNEIKIKLDHLYYEQFFQKLDEDVKSSLEPAMISLYKDINSIYDHINIKPGVYGRDLTFETLNEPIAKTQNKVAKIIHEFLDMNFYSLEGNERKNKYYNLCIHEAKELISSGISPEEAIEFSIKTAVMENFLTNVSFPFAEWSRVKYLCESEEYGEIFDQETLVNLVDSFKSKIHNIAKVVAACV